MINVERKREMEKEVLGERIKTRHERIRRWEEELENNGDFAEDAPEILHSLRTSLKELEAEWDESYNA